MKTCAISYCKIFIYIYNYAVVQLHTLFKFYLPLFLDMVMYDNEFETMGEKLNQG